MSGSVEKSRMSDPFANRETIQRVTNRVKFTAQRRMLDRMGIPYLTGAEGEPLVDRRRLVPEAAQPDPRGPRLDLL